MRENVLSIVQKRFILSALMLTMGLAAMDATIVSTAIPQIVGDLGGFSLFSWLFSIYLLLQTVSVPVYGKLSDVFGRKPIILIGIIIFIVGSGICSLAWNMESLILFRGIQAIGAGAIMATVNTIAGDIYSVKERAKIQGWLSSVWGISAILGPTLGGIIVEHTSWRWIFVINIPLGLIALALIKVHLIEKLKSIRHKVDYKGAFSFLITGTLLMIGLMLGGEKWDWLSGYSMGVFGLFFVFAIITWKIEQNAEEPILPRWIWMNKMLLGSNLITIGAGIMTMASDIYIPVFSQSVLSLSALIAGFILASQSFTWPLFSSLSGKLYLKIGFRNTALIGLLVSIFGLSLFVFMDFPGSSFHLVSIQLLIGAGFGLTFTPTIVGVQSIVSWENRGAVTGSNMFSRYIGQSLGAAIFAAIFNQRLSVEMNASSDSVRLELPKVNEVVTVLQSHSGSEATLSFLRRLFFDATHSVYFSAVVIGLLTVAILLVMPKHFEKIKGK